MVSIIATMVNSKAFSFNKCIFEIRSGLKKKTLKFSNFVKGNTFNKFKFITLRVEKAFIKFEFITFRVEKEFWMISIARYRKVSQVRWAIKNNLCKS